MKKPPNAHLSRRRQVMPADIQKRLNGRRLLRAYQARPAYQQNDYLGWISRAAQTGTREKRIRQMLDELAGGTTYMKMAWRSKSGR